MAIKVQGTTVIDDSRQLSVTGTSTLGSVKVDSGIVTSVTGVVTYFGDASNLTGLTGASAATYGSSNANPIITVNADGRITGITTAAISGISAIDSVVEDTNPQLGGNLDLNSKLINGTGGINITGVATATAFHTGAEGSAVRITSNTISGPAELFIDPAAVGDDTGAVRIKGDLYVDGTTTQINSTTIQLADFIVGIATTATTDLLADGAGIVIGPNNTLLYDHTNTALKSSENLNLATGKTYKINGTDVLSATTLGSNVVNSSLTSVGTLAKLNVAGIVTATSFDGDLTGNADTATLATNVSLLGNNTNDETVYLTFADGATGSQRLETDTALTYNPSTNIIGARSSESSLAFNVNLYANNTNNETVYLTFADGATGTQALETDTGLTYNPSTNIIGARSSESTLAYNVNVNANNTNNETVYLTFVDGATGSQGLETDTLLNYNPSTNVLETTAARASNAYGLFLTGNSDDNNYYVPFTNMSSFPAGTHTAADVHVDSGLLYNPSTNVLDTTAARASTSYELSLTTNSDNTYYFVPFTDMSASPGTTHVSADVHVDSGLLYNPSLNSLDATATRASNAYGLFLTTNSDNVNYFVPFTDMSASPGSTHTSADVHVDGGLLYNPSSNTLDTTSSRALNAYGLFLTTNSDNTNYYIPFTDMSASPGSTHTAADLHVDGGLLYNPSANSLEATAVRANNVNLTATNTDNVTRYLTFADGTTGYQGLETDNSLTYNPSTNLLNATCTSVNINATANPSNTSYVLFVDGATGGQALESDPGLTYNPASNTLTGTISTATSVSVNTYNSSGLVYPTFAVGTSGGQSLKVDTGLSYRADSNTLIASKFQGSGEFLTSIPNSALDNSSVSFGGVSLSLGASDPTPAFDLTDATNYPTSSLTGTITNDQLAGSIADGKLASTFLKNVVEDTTPQLGGNLDLNSKLINGTGGINITGIATATSFSGSGSSLTGLTGASAATYGSSDVAPVITVDANGRITGITTAAISGSGAIASIAEDTTPQLGGDLDLNSNDITGTGNVNITGIITATTFSGSGASLTSIPNSALDNSSVNFGGVTVSLGATDLTPAFDLADATNYPFTSLTGIATHIVGDTTPQLGGTLETNGNLIKFGDSSGATDDRLMFGADNDLSIYHTGSISYISEQGPGALRILSNTVRIRNGSDNQDIAKFVAQGQVELYYNNSKKFETTGIGVSIVGTGNTATITGPSELVLDPAAVGDNTGKVVILGDLQVDGTQTVINSTTLTVDDKSIVLASGAADSSAANGAGIEVDGASATFQYAHSGTKWVANKDLQAEAFIKNGGTSSQFLKADGSVDSSTYLTSESDTLDSVTGRGSTTTNNIDVGEVTADGLNISGISTLTNQAEVRSDDGSQGRIDFYCEVSNAHYTRLQAAAHADYSGNATVTLPSSSGTLLLTDGSGASLTSLNASNLGSGTVPDARFPSTLPAVSGANLTNLTGASAATYGSANATPVIVVDSNGRITGISTVATAGSSSVDATTLGGISSTSFLRSDAADTASGLLTLTNGLNVTSGNVGIGTDSPGVALEIGKTKSTNQIKLKPSDGNVDLRINSAFGNADVASVTVVGAHPLTFHTNNTERIRIESGGDVGIGTDNPSQKLHIHANIPLIRYEEADASADNRRWNVGVNGEEFYWQALNDSGSGGGQIFKMTRTDNNINTFEGRNSGSTWFIADNSSKRIGIGTNSPGTKLHVSNGISGFSGSYNGRTAAVVEGDNSGGTTLSILAKSSGYSGLFFGDEANETRGQIQYVHSNDAFRFITDGGTEALRIDGGKVGIGTDSPDQELHVVGQVKISASDYARVEYARNDINLWSVGIRDTDDFIFYRESGGGSGNVIFQHGDVGIGTDNPAYKLEVNGSFAATTKSFVIDHPTKDGMKLRYGSLEGPENGVYVRGRLKGNDTIELPEHWTGLVDEETITVNLTPIGRKAPLHSVVDITDNTVVVESANDVVDCFYTVFGERKDVEKLEVEF